MVSFPFLEQLGVSEDIDSSGSIDGEVLRRFTVILDYDDNATYLRKPIGFNDGFYFNMAGIQLRAGAFEIFTSLEKQGGIREVLGLYGLIKNQCILKTYNQYTIKQILKLYRSYLRENSPVARAGIMVGDKLEYVSGITGEKLTIAAIHDVFYKRPNKTIRVELLRDGKLLKTKFLQVLLIE
jgi:hypothetical protein